MVGKVSEIVVFTYIIIITIMVCHISPSMYRYYDIHTSRCVLLKFAYNYAGFKIKY